MKIILMLLACFLLCFSGCSKPASQENTVSPVPTLTSALLPDGSTSPTQHPVREGDLQIEVVYHPIVIDDLTEVKAKEGEGIELDLDGDGVAEQIYVCNEGIFINGKRQLLDFDWPRCSNNQYFHPWETYWIVDVDSSDAYYNFIFELGEENPYKQEVLACYAGAMIELGRVELFFSDGFSGAVYAGDGNFQMKQHQEFMGISYAAKADCLLVEGKKITEKFKDVNTQILEDPISPHLMETVMMHSEPSGESVAIEPQEVLLLAVRQRWGVWALEGLFRLEDGTEAWLSAQNNSEWMINQERPAREVFSGFPDVS